MYRTILSATIFCLAASFTFAAPIVQSIPVDGLIAGQAGDTVGLGFDVSADPVLFVSFTASFTLFETDPSLVSYTDFIGTQGGPDNAVLPPNSPDWVEQFDAANQMGIGSFVIDSSAQAGSIDTGTIRIEYDEFRGDPNTCGDCYVASAFQDVSFTVQVNPQAQAMPVTAEPETKSTALAGLGLLLASIRFRRRRVPTPKMLA